MKRQKLDIKKIIKKRIELRHGNLMFVDKRINATENLNNAMNERVKQRIYGVPVKLTDATSINDIDYNFNKKAEEYVYLPIASEKKSVSIIITAYETQDFIEECLDSIENQTYFINNDNYEILVGIDGCQKTLDKVLQIYKKYRNLNVFLLVKNSGTYVTTNTLIDLVKYDNIIRFDSDDVMRPELINEIMYYAGEYDIIQFKYRNFRNNLRGVYGRSDYANGAIFIRKNVFDLFGGYMPWLCAADYEFLTRVNRHIKIKRHNNLLMYRRMHDNSLTRRNDTKMTSSLRKKYHKLIQDKDYSEICFIDKKISNYFKII